MRQRLSIRDRVKAFVNDKLSVQVGQNSIYVWKSRRFEEMIYMHIPRLLFLVASCYVIYRISLRQHEASKWKQGVKSHRQEEITRQI